MLAPSSIRVVTIEGNPWFVAKDVCDTLGYSASARGSILLKLDQSETSLERIQRDLRSVSVVSESGLYKLLMRSDKPEAKPFQDWVTKVVLPAIRKDGMYVMGEEKVATGELGEDELVLKAVSILQKKVDRITKEARPTRPCPCFKHNGIPHGFL